MKRICSHKTGKGSESILQIDRDIERTMVDCAVFRKDPEEGNRAITNFGSFGNAKGTSKVLWSGNS